MSRSVAVTGAAGFLGSWITEQLLEEGWQVTAFDRTADEHNLIAVLNEQAPGCAIQMPEGNGGFREPTPADTAPLEALISPRRHVGLADGVARTIAVMRR